MFELKSRIFLRWALFCFFFFIFFELFSYIALSSFSHIEIIVENDQPARLKIYYSDILHKNQFNENHSFKSSQIPPNVIKKISFDTKNRIFSTLRIDPGESQGIYRIHEIVLHSNFGQKIKIIPSENTVQFTSGPGVTISRNENCVLITSVNDDPYLIIDQDLVVTNWFIKFVMPLVTAILLLFLTKDLQFRRLSCISDIYNKSSSSGVNYTALDGLRGVAALLVLGEHSGIPALQGVGAIGVLIFFGLSGFLLSLPFVKNPSRILSFTYISQYFKRRLKRILPMFYFFLVINYLFRGRFDNFFRHLFFLQGDSFLWTIPQEIYFYIVLPFFLLINFLFMRKSPFFAMVFLFTVVAFFNWTAHDWLRLIYSNGRAMYLWVGVFLNGVFLAFFIDSQVYQQISRVGSRFANNFLVSILFTILLLFPNQLCELIFQIEGQYTRLYFGRFSYLTAGLLFIVVVGEKSLLTKVLRLPPLRAIGIVGYSFYLMHSTGLSITKSFFQHYYSMSITGVPLFFISIIVTYFIASITYSLIERPFIRKYYSPIS